MTCFRADESGVGYQKVWTALADYRAGQPPALRGDLLIVAARQPGQAGTNVVALNADDGSPRWEVVLGAPPAGGPSLAADGKSVRWVHSVAGSQTASATVSDASAAGDIETRVVPLDAAKEAAAAQRGPLVGAVSLADDTLAVVERRGAADQITEHLWFVDNKTGALQASPWTDPVSSPPVGLAGGVLLANPAGQLCLIEPSSGKSLAAPFQPLIAPGATPEWLRPAVVPDKKEAVVADRQGHVYRLSIVEKPAPHLEAVTTATLPTGLHGDVAVCGEFGFVADADGNLNALGLADLKPAKHWPLAGQIVWGPRSVGKWVLVATESELLCFDSRPELVWHVPLVGGLPVDTPPVDGKNFLLATTDGVVARIDQATGHFAAKLELDQPLAGGPVEAGALWVVTARDGSLLFVKP